VIRRAIQKVKYLDGEETGFSGGLLTANTRRGSPRDRRDELNTSLNFLNRDTKRPLVEVPIRGRVIPGKFFIKA
jgi:hypothetical protein